MPEPHSTAAATLAGQAAALPLAGIVATIGVPLDLIGWAMFGGLVAMANSEAKTTPTDWREWGRAPLVLQLHAWD